ncbi:hypothetical protein [Xanthovirga aplysinae]|uniref:hypothetical protein n=1 Tax=Xanthovirga aplysinae TaxID=2529853 RepID=UPI0012BD6F36|nr:hypothetical protein [Xanthovirga aplysinae]MTI30797.1 hypothetical protein [Xanthovirga aplysinae]
MEVVSKLISRSWAFSFLIFLGVFLYVYAALPNQVALFTPRGSFQTIFIDRSLFFYSGISIFIVWNALFYVLRGMLGQLPVRETSFFKSESFKIKILNWLISFALVVNVFFVFTVSLVGIFNRTSAEEFTRFSPFIYVGPVLMAIWLVALVVILAKRK